MKKILILCAAVLVAGAAYVAWRYAQPEHYGHAFTGAPEISVRQLTQKDTTVEAKDVRVEGQIVRQCPVTGCWFYLDDSKGNQIRVELGNVVPRLPQKVGQRAVVEGRLVMMGDEPVFAGNGVEFKK